MPVPEFIRRLRARIGHELVFAPGVCALVFNHADHILLGRRADNGRWAVIGGVVEPGEQPADAVVREVLEETNVRVIIERISGVYLTSVVTYPNGDVAQYIVTAFRCRAIDGEARVNDDESLEVRYFPLNDLPPMSEDHLAWIADATTKSERAFFRHRA